MTYNFTINKDLTDITTRMKLSTCLSTKKPIKRKKKSRYESPRDFGYGSGIDDIYVEDVNISVRKIKVNTILKNS